MKKFICLLIAIICTMSFVACTPAGTGSGGSVNEDGTPKSVLKVAVIDSGYGTAFAEEQEKDFELYHANTVFEDGHRGVDVELVPGLEEYSNSTLINKIRDYDTTVYMQQFRYPDFVAQDLLVDLTELVEEVIYDEDGNLAKDTGKPAVYCMEDLYYDGFAEYNRKVDGKSYGVPYAGSVGGVIYDADLFDRERLFMDKNGKFDANFEDIENGNCSTGPDLKMGTFDDGMPVTLKDFANLMSEMVKVGVTPFCFSGKYTYTRNAVVEQIHAAYEGPNNYALNYSFDGFDTGLNKQITEENYKDLLDQNGRKAAIEFFYEISKNSKYYTPNSIVGSDHTGAQLEFIYSVETNNPIAMFCEGGWWESESRTVFEDMSAISDDYAYGKRNFRLFPIPRFDGSGWTPAQTNNVMTMNLNGCSSSNIFLSKYNASENPEIAEKIGKEFIRFINQRSQIIKYTKNTGGCIRGLKVPTDYTEEELSTLTKYGRSIYEYVNDGAVLVPEIDLADKRFYNSAAFGSGDGGWSFACSLVGGTFYNEPLNPFVLGGATSCDQVFQGMKSEILRVYAG